MYFTGGLRFNGRGANSGFRLIYAYFKDEPKIIFVELYHKNDKENEDRQRILNNFIGIGDLGG